jgi:hypothetical protein
MMRQRRAALVASFFTTLCIVDAAPAQGWVRLPNGELGYITDYTTTGLFQCAKPFYIIGSCSASGNVMTLGTGSNSITFTFNGVSDTITAGKSKEVRLGTLTKSFSGSGPHVFPSGRSFNVPIFYFSIFFTTSFPIPATDSWTGGYVAKSPTKMPHNCCSGTGPNYVTFPITEPPEPYGYSKLIFYDFTGTTFTVDPYDIEVAAQVAVIPEPATIWLTGSGLIGLFAFRRRRSRQR